MIGLVKVSVGLVGGIGTTVLTRVAVTKLTPSDVNKFGKICIRTASFLVSSAAVGVVTKEANKQVDEYVGLFSTIKKKFSKEG